MIKLVLKVELELHEDVKTEELMEVYQSVLDEQGDIGAQYGLGHTVKSVEVISEENS